MVQKCKYTNFYKICSLDFVKMLCNDRHSKGHLWLCQRTLLWTFFGYKINMFCFPCFAALCFHIVSRLELGGPFLLHTCYFYLILVAIHVSDDLQNQFFILIQTDICCFMLFMYDCSCSGMWHVLRHTLPDCFLFLTRTCFR